MPKSRYVLILAGNAKQAATYARRNGLRGGQYRAVASASSIRNIRVADVHILPEFLERVDRHAIFAALRYGRDIVYYDVEMPEPPPTDQGDGMGEQLDLLDLASTYEPPRKKSLDPVIDFVTPEPAAESLAHVGATEADAAERAGDDDDRTADFISPTAEPPKPRTRRSRCKTCGRLTIAPYEKSPAEHDATKHAPAAAPTSGLFS